MAKGLKSQAILNGLLVGGPFGAISAAVATSEGGDAVAAQFNSEVAARTVPASVNPLPVPTLTTTGLNASGQVTYAGIPLTYLWFGGVSAVVLILLAMRE